MFWLAKSKNTVIRGPRDYLLIVVRRMDICRSITASNLLNTFLSFSAGGAGGTSAVLSGHPFDTIKVRLQTMPLPKPGEKPMYTGMWNCVVKTVKREGVFGLYKGMGAPLVGVSPIFALSFFGNDFGKKLQNCQRGIFKVVFSPPIFNFPFVCFESFLPLS